MENEDKLYSYWLVLIPKMDEDSFVEFEDFKAKMLPAKIITDKSDDEIIKELMAIRSKFE